MASAITIENIATMSPQEFFANHSLLGGTSTGNFFVDFFLRPVFRLGFDCPVALVLKVVAVYGSIFYFVWKSAYCNEFYN